MPRRAVGALRGRGMDAEHGAAAAQVAPVRPGADVKIVQARLAVEVHLELVRDRRDLGRTPEATLGPPATQAQQAHPAAESSPG